MSRGGSIDIIVIQGDRPEELARSLRSVRGLGRVLVVGRADAEDAVREGGAELIDEASWPVGEDGTRRLGDLAIVGEWVLVLGANECVSPELRRSLGSARLAGADGWSVKIRTLFLGRRIRFGGFGGEASVRLVRAEGARLLCRLDRTELVCEGSVRGLDGSLLRVRAAPLCDQLERMLSQAMEEAERLAGTSQRTVRVPGRYFGASRRFLSRFVLRLGFLDGRGGYHLALLDANRLYMTRILAQERLGRIVHEHSEHAIVRVRHRSGGRVVSGRTCHPLSVIILTRDEEINLADCLRGVSFSDDIIVFDSLSEDRTAEIARSFENVSVVERKFDNWSAHQNWGVSHIEFKHPWVLYIDADERVDEDLAAELQSLADPDAPISAYRMRRKDIFMDQWIRHATLYPTWLVRMFRPEKIHYKRLVNPVAVVDGPIGTVEGHLIHYPFSKGVTQWFERHNSYSGFEAEEQLKVTGGQRRPTRDVFSRDPNDRRAALKDIFFRLPMRPHVKWLYYFIWRRAFLDGRAGMTYARLQYIYEYMIQMKARERRHERAGGRR